MKDGIKKQLLKATVKSILLLSFPFGFLFLAALGQNGVDTCLDHGGGWDSKQEICFYSCSWKYAPEEKDCIPEKYLDQLQDCLDDGGGWDAKENICRPD